MSRTVFFTFLLILIPASARAVIYRCQDADGVPRFTDTPCDTVTQSLRKLPDDAAAAPPQDERGEKTQKLLRAFEDERRLAREQKDKQAAQRAERAKRCSAARGRLQNMQDANALYRNEANGERHFLTDEEREQALARAQLAVQQWCGDQ
jgi:hypothetical protein